MILQFSFVIADFKTSDRVPDWLSLHPQLGLQPVVVLETGQLREAFTEAVVACVLFLEEARPDQLEALNLFFRSGGCLPDAILIVTDSSQPEILAEGFEYGVTKFCTVNDWQSSTEDLIHEMSSRVQGESPEVRIHRLAQAIRAGEQNEIQHRLEQAQPLCEFDYRVCFQMGQAHEALGYFSHAIQSYEQVLALNPYFRLASASFAECKMILGKTDEARQLFEEMRKTNTGNANLTAQLASAHAELGNREEAMRLLKSIEERGYTSSKILEAKAQIFLATGKLNEAFKLMDEMSEVGPFFAAKLNELGIRLSQAGKGKSALALYHKAHKIVRPDLKYKISLNAALACRRNKQWSDALKYLARCEKEYGNSFPKLEKIRRSLMMAQAREQQEAS